jgi:transcriptional regulator with XRE-family HTH domain
MKKLEAIKQVRVAMAEKELTQLKVQELSGIDRNVLSRFLNGKNITTDNLFKIMEVLDLSIKKD